jgi:hypothetical protein
MEVKMNNKEIPGSVSDAPPCAYVPPGTVSPGTKVVSDDKPDLRFTDMTVLPLLPPYKDVPTDCRRIWLEIYAELVRGR